MTGETPVAGLTTTIPVEVLYAAGWRPLDLNNWFITSAEPGRRVAEAERDGFPRSLCSWIKGIYGAALHERPTRVVAVTQGDCSNTHALMELLRDQGFSVIPFAYPFDRDRQLLALQIEVLEQHFGVTRQVVEVAKVRLDAIRRLAHELDRLTWEEGRLTGEENHAVLIGCSDFGGDPDAYAARLQALARQARERSPFPDAYLRLGFVGIPPMFSDFYSFLEQREARVVFNELQRQFAMPWWTEDLVTQYQRYTYPYDMAGRLADIEQEVQRRSIEGLIHYVQSFCFRQVHDILLRRKAVLPILTIEGDRPGPLDARTRVRIEAFLEVLRAKRKSRDPDRAQQPCP